MTQYLLIPRKNGRCSKIIENSKNRNAQTFGFVYHDTNGLNHCPVWKTQSFLLSEICTVILWQDCYEKGNLRKSYCSTVGRRFPCGNAYSLIRCGKYSIKKLIWENQHLSTQRQCEISKDIMDNYRAMFES